MSWWEVYQSQGVSFLELFTMPRERNHYTHEVYR